MKEQIDLLKMAASEIRTLRSHNQLMSARLEMFDSMMLMFNTQPAYRGQGASPDIVYSIDKYVANAEAEAEKYPTKI